MSIAYGCGGGPGATGMTSCKSWRKADVCSDKQEEVYFLICFIKSGRKSSLSSRGRKMLEQLPGPDTKIIANINGAIRIYWNFSTHLTTSL